MGAWHWCGCEGKCQAHRPQQQHPQHSCCSSSHKAYVHRTQPLPWAMCSVRADRHCRCRRRTIGMRPRSVMLMLAMAVLGHHIAGVTALPRLLMSDKKIVISPAQEGRDTDPAGASLLDFDALLDGGQHHSCMDLFISRTQAIACSAIPPPEGWQGPRVAAEVCNLPGGDVMVSVVTASDLHAVFHAMLVGPQMAVPPISTCGISIREEGNGVPKEQIQASNTTRAHRRATAHQLLITDMVPGEYELTLRMMYKDFTFSEERAHTADSACGQPLWRLPLTIQSRSGDSSPDNADCTYCGAKPSSWPACDKPYLQGAVLLGEELTRLPQNNSRNGSSSTAERNITKLLLDVGKRRDAWEGKMRWQPQGCNMLPTLEVDVAKCFRNRIICFVGDSHSRHAHNGLVDAVVDQGLRAVNSTPFTVIYPDDKIRFIWETWGDLEQVEAFENQLDNCTDIIFGVGSWPLSNKIARWTAGHYARALARSFHVAQRMQHDEKHPKRVFFLTSPYHVYTCKDWEESRTPPFLALFNELAVGVADFYKIKVINVADITQPLYQTAHDRIHHHYVGFVGATITQYILNVLCVQPPLG